MTDETTPPQQPPGQPPPGGAAASAPHLPGDAGAPLPFGSIFAEAWELFVRDAGVWILAALVHGLIYLTCVGLLLVGPLTGGLYLMAFKAMRGERPTFEDSFRGFDLFVPLFVVALLGGIGILAGLIFCILPGLYLMVAWIFALPLVVDGSSAGEALQRSMDVVNRNFGSVLVLVLLLVLINAVGSSVVLGFVITQPLMILGTAIAYRRIFG